MKSRTSFFDKTVLKKDLTRFFPLWALYLIGGLLIMHILSGFYGSYYPNRAYTAARALNSIIGLMGLVHAGYAFLAAQLLFGDLHSPRLCCGVHAFPLRREGWYLTHVTSGLLMGLIPPLVIVLTLLPVLEQFWFTGFLCWGALSLHYLFFFGLATFCMMATGNRFAATAIYGILNFLALIVYWFAQSIYLPMLPGVRINASNFSLFCPVVELISRQDFFRITHLDTCPCHKYSEMYFDYIHDYGFTGLGGDWGYLWILAGAGIALLVLGLLLYRRRHLERAGDFMVFKPMKPIFLWVYSLCVGAALFFFGKNFGDAVTGYFFFVLGIFIGFFTGKMLLERTVRVFQGRSFAGLGILYAAVLLSLLLTWADPIGISRRIPKSEKVEMVYLYDGYLSDYQLNSDRRGVLQNTLVVTDPEDIAGICEIHGMMLQEHQNDNSSMVSDWRHFSLQYHMKNGSTVSRTYRIYTYGEAMDALRPYLSKPAYLFGVQSLEQLQRITTSIYSNELMEIPEPLWPELLKAMWLDAQEGYLSVTGENTSGKPLMYMELRLKNQYRVLYFTEDAPHLQQWLEQYSTIPQLVLKHGSLEKLITDTYNIYDYDADRALPEAVYSYFLTMLWQDCQNGKVESSGKWSEGIYIEVQTGDYYLSLSLAKDSQCAQWLQAYAEVLLP